MTPQNNLNSSLASLRSAIENSESEEQLRSDPAYFAYYCSNVNLNPRLPPPLISRENQRLEESEDDRSPCQTSDDWPESSSAVMPGQKTASSAGRHKSLPCSNGELLDLDFHAISLNDSSLEISKLPEPGPGTVDVSASTCTLDAPAIGLMPNKDDAANSFPSSSYSDRKHSSLPLPKDESSDKGEVGALVNEGAGLEVSRVESKTKAPNVSILLVAENNANKQGQKPSYERNAPPHHPYAQQTTLIMAWKNFPCTPKFSLVEVQPMTQSPGLTLLCLFAPQYGVGGYSLSSALVPQFIGGYPTPAVIPMPFDATFGPSFNARTTGRIWKQVSKIALPQQFILHDFDASDHGTPSFAVLPKTRYIGLKWTGMESFELNKRLMMLSSGSDTESLPFYFIHIRTSFCSGDVPNSSDRKKIQKFSGHPGAVCCVIFTDGGIAAAALITFKLEASGDVTELLIMEILEGCCLVSHFVEILGILQTSEGSHWLLSLICERAISFYQLWMRRCPLVAQLKMIRLLFYPEMQ
ncbi:hypothetical protein AAG906_020391 [Vitis piasezkii]